jgi:hypothetical protein
LIIRNLGQFVSTTFPPPFDVIAATQQQQPNYITILKSDSNEVPNEPAVFESTTYCIDNKSDEMLEAETRGIDVKGNVRWFCPKCNCRYIGG